MKTLKLLKELSIKSTNTGCPEVQVAQLTDAIESLVLHLKDHKHDYHSQRGLMLKVGQRRRLLKYIQKHSQERYTSVIKSLGLRK